MSSSRPAEPRVAGRTAHLRLADPEGRWRSVRLWQEVGLPGSRLDLAPADGGWELALDLPADVDRVEYLFVATGPDGGTEHLLDPANPRRVGGAFGDHSVLELPGYAPPPWLGVDAPEGTREPLAAGGVDGQLWASAGLAGDAPAPLVVAHDGPEYDDLAALTRCLAGLGRPVRAALLAPGPRDERYSADPAYADLLAGEVLPALRARVPVTGVLGLGASLGGLAWLHAQRRHPGVADALLLQSATFFHRRLDPQEAGFARFGRIARFVEEVLAARTAPRPVPTVLTCGRREENLANNRAVAQALARQGYGARLVEVADVHNYTAWRDALQPHLGALVARVARAAP
ncbi:alpha/beta hydrolase-fold protein [Vallicoccus soli]|uniref:Esterase n=1 Tax=Vallicoccus soli TaxID=2339232 RepID=A0A3A3Z508_9ACTN|nr:alpha/beta hydrolase-fold protein [Vallicoccus soli]RJK98063.1 esterase [Vallicoccus soli]